MKEVNRKSQGIREPKEDRMTSEEESGERPRSKRGVRAFQPHVLSPELGTRKREKVDKYGGLPRVGHNFKTEMKKINNMT